MGLADVGAFLQNQAQWRVQKPILQQQAADAHALAQAQIGQADVQSKLAQREWAKQNLTLDPDKVVSAANPPQDTESDDPGAGGILSPTPDATSQSLPNVSVSRPVAAPKQSTNGPVFVSDDFTNKFAGRTTPVGDSVVPGSTDSAPASLPRTSPNLGSTAGAPKDDETPAEETPYVPGQSLPPVTPAPTLQPSDLLTTRFYDLPQAAQDEILRQGREQMKAAGFHITDQELVQHYNENQQRALPILSPQSLMSGGMVPVRYSQEKGMELVNPGLGQAGASGQPGNQQYHYDPLTGQNVEDKNFWTDDVIQKNRNDYAQHLIAAQQLQQVQNVLKRNPGVVGAVSGGKAGQLVRQAAAALGYRGAYTDENTLRQWLAEQMKRVMGSVSNVKNQQEFENLQKSITDPKWTVENWQDAINRAGEALNAEHSALTENFARHGLSPIPAAQLPPVNLNDQAPVSAPGGEKTISTKEEFNALPKGAHFTWQYPDGTTRSGIK